MALLSKIERGALVIRSVGDQEIDEGLAQLDAGVALAQEALDRTGERPHTLIDLTESLEAKSTAELDQIVSYFAANSPPLSGRIAMVAPEDLLFGLSRVFSAHGEREGLEAAVFRTHDEAWSWLGA